MEDPEVSLYYDDRRAAVLVRCDDCRGGLVRRLRTLSTFSFYESRPRVALTAGINPPGWTRRMWRRLARMIQERGWEAASHTMDHPWLTRVDEKRVRDELERSRDAIREGLAQAGIAGVAVPTFIYPYGDYGARELGLLRETGYVLGLTYLTEEDVTAVPARASLYEWGYTLNAPEREDLEPLLERFRSVYESRRVFSVTTHPPVVRPDKRLRSPDIYAKSGSWARLLDHMCGVPDVWFTTFGTLAAYHAQASTANVRRAGDTIAVTYEVANSPLPATPLTVAFASGSAPASVRIDGALLRRRDQPTDLPTSGWRYDGRRVIASLPGPGRLTIESPF